MYPVFVIGAVSGTFFYIYLSLKVVKLRRHHQVSIGSGNHKDLDYAIRAHGNFTECTPLALALVLSAEIRHGSLAFVATMGLLFALGRILHAYAFLKKKHNLRFRQTGMAMTLLSMLMLAVYNIFLFF